MLSRSPTRTSSPVASTLRCQCARNGYRTDGTAPEALLSVTLGHLRHYAATAMLNAGESYRTVADILGNSESTLRLHYDGRTDVGKRKAIAALELGSSVADGREG